MAALTSALARRTIPGLLDSIPAGDGFREWLRRGSYYFGASSTPQALQLDNIPRTDILPYLNFDYSRFALASWETFSVAKAEREKLKAISWPVLKLYYSAFFAAHALLRASGSGVVLLDGDVARAMTQVASLYGLPLTVTAGSYVCTVSANAQGNLDVSLTLESLTGGVHEAFWKRFRRFLIDLASDVAANNEVGATDVVTTVVQLRDALDGGGGFDGTWLSTTRNRLNYRHELDVWFPSKPSRPELTQFDLVRARSCDEIRLDQVDAHKTPLTAFVSANHFLSMLSFEIVEQHLPSCRRDSIFPRNWRALRNSMKDGARS